jgi:hypothetical protein
MTACMQPRCTGMIIDGYCDVCGSPAGAAPFLPAAVSAASPAATDEPGPTAVRREPGLSPEPNSGSPITACTQPGCIGVIVDGYCDVCGSPAGAVPFLPAAVSAASPAAADEPGPTAVRREPGLSPEPNSGSPITACTQPGCIGVIVDGYCDVCGSPAGAVPFLPAAVSAAPAAPTDEPGLTAAPGPIDEEIATQRISRMIDVEGSREVEATLRRLIEPAAADLEEADTAEVEPAAGDLEEADTAEVEPAVADLEAADIAEGEPAAADLEAADTAPAGPQQDDTVKMPVVPAVLSGGRHQDPQLPEQPVGPEPVQTPAKKRRFGYLALAATVLAALLIGAFLFAASRDRGVTAQSVPTVTTTPTATPTKPTSEPTIQLEDLADSARPFQAVRIEGTYRSGPDRFLQVQRWEGGKWLAFPVPTKTDKSGKFTAYVELEQPGRYRLRVLDPGSGLMSKPFVVVIT